MTRERPMLFSAPMVRAILAGTKTQTRRALAPDLFMSSGGAVVRMASAGPATTGIREAHCPYWREPGDRLWVRETWAVGHNADHLKPSEMDPGGWSVHYAATEDLGGLRKRPGMFMPRWASRITLEITGVRVERLQEISEGDAYDEGTAEWCAETQRNGNKWPNIVRAYRGLWEQINGPGSWDANPWVWVLSFKRQG